MESKTRSIVKAGIWTLLGLTMMTVVGFAMTGSIEQGGAMAALNSVIGMISYILYERVWAKVSWGRDA